MAGLQIEIDQLEATVVSLQSNVPENILENLLEVSVNKAMSSLTTIVSATGKGRLLCATVSADEAPDPYMEIIVDGKTLKFQTQGTSQSAQQYRAGYVSKSVIAAVNAGGVTSYSNLRTYLGETLPLGGLAYLTKEDIDNQKVFPEETIVVSENGLPFTQSLVIKGQNKRSDYGSSPVKITVYYSLEE